MEAEKRKPNNIDMRLKRTKKNLFKVKGLPLLINYHLRDYNANEMA